MESLSELNKIVQKPDYKKTGNWMVRTFLRDAALPCTWLLLHTPVTANQVTLFALLTGLLSAVFLAVKGPGFFLTACLLLQLWYYLDHVDGQIARYRKTAGVTGRFFDFLMHHVIHGAVLFALGFYCALRLESPFYYFWAFSVSFSMSLFNMLHDIKSKAFIEKLLQGNVWKINDEKKTVSADTSASQKESSLPKQIFSLLHKLCEIHVLMNIMTGLAVFSVITGAVFDARKILFCFYGFVIPVITIVKISFVILHRKIDEEFEDAFKTVA